MRKKVLAALMAMLMVFGVVGCGGDSGTSASSIPPETRPTESSVVESEAEESTEEQETEGAERPSEETGESQETVESDVMGDDGAEVSEEETVSNSGIIVCVLRNAGLGMDYAIFQIDPETGHSKELNSFSHRNTNDGYLEMPPTIYYQNCASMVSQDATKLAMTYTDNSTKLHHAGWIDNKGVFFDVPEALGMQAANEFVAQPHYYALGFTRDGEYFVFAEITGDQSSLLRYESDFDKFYYVSLNDLLTVYEGNPLRDEARKGYDNIRYALTDWIDEDSYLVDLLDNCIIRSVTNPGSGDIELVPGETRRNYNAVVGPDGRIAFASCIKQTGEDLAIYVTDSDGSNPQRVFDCGTFTAPDGKFPNGYIIIYVMWWK